MDNITFKAIQKTQVSEIVFRKFLAPTDVGASSTNQSGLYLNKYAGPQILGKQGEKGSNKERWITVKWQEDFETSPRVIYYGQHTRNEYRITNLGLDKTLWNKDSVGSLLILCRVTPDYYYGYLLSNDEDIEEYLNFFNLSPNEVNGHVSTESTDSNELVLLQKYLQSFGSGFPSTNALSDAARNIFYELNNKPFDSDIDADKAILSWTDIEYRLFQLIEQSRYETYLNESFESVAALIEAANKILNRRKSRAGKSLEHHLAKIFDIKGLSYSAQQVTESHKKPDFLMPGIEFYQNTRFPSSKLTFLGAKTTCKDRWRQILNEAERIPNKHLFTLQPSISSNQLNEMKAENVTLVVPSANKNTFPEENKQDILTLDEFIRRTKALQS